MSSEVGSGHISIFPVMTGFKSAVSKETKAAGVDGARSFDRGFKGVGTSTGRMLGRDLKAAMSQSAKDIATAQVTKFKGEVASAAQALSKARAKQLDDAGRVRAAEARLAEVVAKSGAESASAITASERLASLRRTEAASTDAVTAATARLRGAQQELSSASGTLTALSDKAAGRTRQTMRNLRDGFTDANAARSSFTGLAGSIGGVMRAVSDVSGLTKLGGLAKLAAQRASTAFTSLATMVGGKVALMSSAVKTWAGGVGATIRGAFGPAVQYVGAAGTLMAAPFVRLGSKISGWLSPITSQVGGLFRKLGQNVGAAFSGIAGHVRATAGPLLSAAGTAFQGIVGAAGRAASAAGRALGSGIQSAATGAVTVAATAIGVAFGKGFSRLTAIDTAQAKLRGLLGDASLIAPIMNDATSSVKGTAFGLGEAAGVAASAVAAQIKPGEELQTHLKRIANNAAAAGTSMTDMGAIFNKAANQANGVQNDVIGMLADKGIPIYKALGDQMGVTAGEVFKMASEGKVDFATFSTAAEKAAGTVAKEMATTVPGAAKNFFASMGRIGANALGGIYTKIAPLITAATSALGPIEEKAKVFGDVLLTRLGPALDWITNLLNQVGSGTSILDGKLDGLKGILGPLGGAFLALGAGGLGGLLARLGPLGAMLPGLTRGLAFLGGPVGILAAAFAGLALSSSGVDGLVSSLTGIVTQVVAALPGVISAVVEVVPQIVTALLSALPGLLSAGAEIVQVLLGGIIQSIPLLVTGALTLIDGLVSALIANLPAIVEGAIQLVTALLDGIVLALPLLITGALKLVTGLLGGIVALLPTIIQGGVQLLMAIVMGLVQALPMLVQSAVGLVMGLLQAIIDNLPLIIQAGVQLLLSLVTGLINALPDLITAAIDLVLQLIVGLVTMLPQMITAGITMVIAIAQGLIEAIPQLIEKLPEIVNAIWTALTEVDWLSLGAQIIQGIIDGFGSMLGAVGEAVGGIVGTITDFFPHSPAKRGPLSGAGWGRLKSSGKSMLDQFNDGALDAAPGFGDTVEQMARDASARAQVTMSAASAAMPSAPSSSAPSGGGGGVSIVQNNTLQHVPFDEAVQATGQQLNSIARRNRS